MMLLKIKMLRWMSSKTISMENKKMKKYQIMSMSLTFVNCLIHFLSFQFFLLKGNPTSRGQAFVLIHVFSIYIFDGLSLLSMIIADLRQIWDIST